jgi:hypothetical protein
MIGFRGCVELAATEDFANCDGGFHGRVELARDGGFRGRVELASDGGRRSTNDGGGRL